MTSLPPEPQKPELNSSTANLVVVDGLPKVDQAKYDKLVGFVQKSFALAGPIKEFIMPMTNGLTSG